MRLFLFICLATLFGGAHASNLPRLIALEEDRNFCLSTDNNPKPNDAVTFRRCDANAKGQHFLFDNRGRWQPNEAPDLCVVVPRNIPQAGDRLELASCSGNQSQDWFFDDSGFNELQARKSDRVCATYSGTSASNGARAVMERCTGGQSQSFDFKYDKPDRPGGDWEQLRMRRNPTRCISIDRGDASAGRVLKTERCNGSNRAQHWRFQDDSTWRPRENTDLCVVLEQVQTREDLILRDCTTSLFRRWHYNENDLFEISPQRDSSLCIARDKYNFLEVLSCRQLNRSEREWELIEV
mmetsp:Transcript_16173/g.26943  ORF Transcript_16173/g.26943 Transcript_16173/m.26943 type:complete len:296 (-) Transcript_16173:327-1214(-)|eukprot:CAMPEP_0197722046 /NCGR_PEP_ID=MMETSP1434-20131217/4875_1 /TAXON_ID=265543 /ORGANISM="Minutocellus polymorphus, Strain CCMP3303" /LENGTH=295 /DNA_ID=CAMNT_0043307137 /DNA_START=106 /DNA_END=993 /DNA_ORIENTATION=-